MELRNLKGTKEYLPKEQIAREEIIAKIKEILERYGYMPIETSILEFYDIATSKYIINKEILGEIYRLKDRANRDLCLRYELTFKLAKLIGSKKIGMPFKRYEVGKIFRDGPIAKARLREFTQFDVDCVGIKTGFIDAEFMAITFDVFSSLGLDVIVKINNRKLLIAMLKELNIEKIDDAITALDKLDKYGKDVVIKEMKEKKINEEKIKKIFGIFEKCEKKNNKEKLEFLNETLKNNEAKEGIKEIEEFLMFCDVYLKEKAQNIVFVPSLARGFAYYTGMVWEVYSKKQNIKRSLAAGGRWDNLVKQFLQSKEDYPAVGISFGVDAIYEAIKNENKEKKLSRKKISVLVIPVEKEFVSKAIEIAQELRKYNLSIEISAKNLTKSLEYANKKNIDYCIIIGKEESKKKKVRLKNMKSGKEELIKLIDEKIEKILKKFKEKQL